MENFSIPSVVRSFAITLGRLYPSILGIEKVDTSLLREHILWHALEDQCTELLSNTACCI